jgi:DNA-directed RNA polymerase specialized sigma24 family protein
MMEASSSFRPSWVKTAPFPALNSGESALLDPADPGKGGIEEVVGDEPTPLFAAEVAEECQRLLDKLGDDELRRIAISKLEGYTNREIADLLGCALVTVERRLHLTRSIWKRAATTS